MLTDRLPLVSCVMPTRDRPEFVQQSIRYFERQNYPTKELIILDDSVQQIAPVTGDHRIRRVRMRPGTSIGAKRNHGCLLAKGTIIAQWDDDDWYGVSRLSTQVNPILRDGTDVTAFEDCTFLELAKWIFWRCNSRIFKRMFVGDVHGGTLVFRRSLFEAGMRYPDQSFGEDAYFLYQCNRKGAQISGVMSDSSFIYVRHGHSTWQFDCGTHLDPKGWVRVPEPSILLEDLQFLKSQSSVV
jgi:O-antigen biosynthesis protein